MSGADPMDRRRLRFFLASSLFLGWVFGLGMLAWLSGARPQYRPPAAVKR